MTTPPGYTPIESGVPNPHPIEDYEDCETRWSDNGKNYVWVDDTIYEKDAPTVITTEWVQNYGRYYPDESND